MVGQSSEPVPLSELGRAGLAGHLDRQVDQVVRVSARHNRPGRLTHRCEVLLGRGQLPYHLRGHGLDVSIRIGD